MPQETIPFSFLSDGDDNENDDDRHHSFVRFTKNGIF